MFGWYMVLGIVHHRGHRGHRVLSFYYGILKREKFLCALCALCALCGE